MIDYQEIAKSAGSVGLLIDRCVRDEPVIGTVFVVDNQTVATAAHLVILYSEFLRGLKVVFPSTGETWEVVSAKFHPKFNRENATEMAHNGLREPVAALALQDHNVVLLTISQDVSALPKSEATTFNKRLSSAPLPRVKGLSGSVEEIGLALVIQTINNARKDGVLYITDERNRPLARMFFSDGKMRFAKYGKLQNETAIYQMFQRQLVGDFHLKMQAEPDWPVGAAMERGTESMLLEAHRRLDEAPKLLEKLGGPLASYMRTVVGFKNEAVPPEVAAWSQQLLPFLDGGISIDHLYDVAVLDDYAVYAALVELLWAKQVVAVNINPPPSAAPPGLELAPYEPLSPWDEVVSMTVHPENGRAQMRAGQLVGLLRPNDPYHLLHTMNLPYTSAGSPILKNGKVIGLHCGMLPLDPALHALPRHLHQLLWIDSVQTCHLTEEPKKKEKVEPVAVEPEPAAATKSAVAHRPSVGMVRPDLTADMKLCPKCQSLMVKKALFCGTCGHKLK